MLNLDPKNKFYLGHKGAMTDVNSNSNLDVCDKDFSEGFNYLARSFSFQVMRPVTIWTNIFFGARYERAAHMIILFHALYNLVSD